MCPYLEMKAELEERPLTSVGTKGKEEMGVGAGVRAWVSVRWGVLWQRVKGHSGAYPRHRISQLEDRRVEHLPA